MAASPGQRGYEAEDRVPQQFHGSGRYRLARDKLLAWLEKVEADSEEYNAVHTLPEVRKQHNRTSHLQHLVQQVRVSIDERNT